MKSRMDKYYKDDNDLQRTSKNMDLYEKLYKDKQEPDSNIAVFDNVDEIDIEKIKDMVNSREGYRTAKKYENWTNQKEEAVPSNKRNYEIEGIDDSKYDINQILEKKKQCRNEEECDKLRKLSETQPIILSEIDSYCENEDDDAAKELMDTLTSLGNSTDFFSNLKEDVEEETKKEEVTETTTIVKEESFYTDTVSFENEDFDDVCETNNGISVFLKIIIILSFLIAIGVFVYFKFLS